MFSQIMCHNIRFSSTISWNFLDIVILTSLFSKRCLEFCKFGREYLHWLHHHFCFQNCVYRICRSCHPAIEGENKRKERVFASYITAFSRLRATSLHVNSLSRYPGLVTRTLKEKISEKSGSSLATSPLFQFFSTSRR